MKIKKQRTKRGALFDSPPGVNRGRDGDEHINVEICSSVRAVKYRRCRWHMFKVTQCMSPCSV